MDYPRLLSGSEVSQGPSILEKGGRRREKGHMKKGHRQKREKSHMKND